MNRGSVFSQVRSDTDKPFPIVTYNQISSMHQFYFVITDREGVKTVHLSEIGQTMLIITKSINNGSYIGLIKIICPVLLFFSACTKAVSQFKVKCTSHMYSLVRYLY